MRHDRKQNVREPFQDNRGAVSKENTSSCFPWERIQILQDTTQKAQENHPLPPAAVC